jgi:hypothetical protein
VIAAVAIPGRAVPHPRSQRFAPLGRPWAWLDSFGAAVARELEGGARLVSPSFRVGSIAPAPVVHRDYPPVQVLDQDLRVLRREREAAVEERCWPPGGDTTFVLSLADVVRGRPSCRDRFPEGTPRLLRYRV